MFNRLLIASRGEIACRIIRTARAMGIETFAIYTAEEAQALHVQQADRAMWVESYLDIERIIEIAQKAQVDAIHPGYGFLSENVNFAKACQEVGIVFVGPSAECIAAMGSKATAKTIAEKVVVPVTPGYNGANQDSASLQSQAEHLGFPLMIKAIHGGGGKGMRRVEKGEDFQEALASCQREAQSSFGNGDVLLEKLIQNPRHIEVQVFGDTHGNIVHLFERDCSVQRRHQKIIEEAPAWGVPEHVKAQMYEAAVKIAHAVNYVGAGTVEFLLDEDQSFYFMEMNTRLQVEHPVTEEITGLDLVEWQLLVAAGEKLPLSQDEITQQNHAVELRIYAENPRNNFLPSTGKLSVFRLPAGSYRLETGVEEGSTVEVTYDPMLAKLIVVGEAREDCFRKARNLLKGWPILGVYTNLELLQNLLEDDGVIRGFVDVGYVDRNLERCLPVDENYTLFARCAAIALNMTDRVGCDPWSDITGWRLSNNQPLTTSFETHGQTINVSLAYDGQKWWVDGADWIKINQRGSELSIQCSKAKLEAYVSQRQTGQWDVWLRGKTATLKLHDPLQDAKDIGEEDHGLTAPMTATVAAVDVKVGDHVQQGQRLVVLEAMKMEHPIRAPRDGRVGKVFFSLGDVVKEGENLLEFEGGSNDTPLAQAS